MKQVRITTKAGQGLDVKQVEEGEVNYKKIICIVFLIMVTINYSLKVEMTSIILFIIKKSAGHQRFRLSKI